MRMRQHSVDMESFRIRRSSGVIPFKLQLTEAENREQTPEYEEGQTQMA